MQEFIKELGRRFIDRNLTLSVAESCTGGTLSAAIVSEPGASLYFKGGIVSYSNAMKVDVLNVKRGTLAALGAVSYPVALQMADGVRKGLETTWSIGITGIAGPEGGSSEKPVGTVFIAVCGPGFEVVESHEFPGSRQEVISASVERAIKFLLESTI